MYEEKYLSPLSKRDILRSVKMLKEFAETIAIEITHSHIMREYAKIYGLHDNLTCYPISMEDIALVNILRTCNNDCDDRMWYGIVATTIRQLTSNKNLYDRFLEFELSTFNAPISYNADSEFADQYLNRIPFRVLRDDLRVTRDCINIVEMFYMSERHPPCFIEDKLMGWRAMEDKIYSIYEHRLTEKNEQYFKSNFATIMFAIEHYHPQDYMKDAVLGIDIIRNKISSLKRDEIIQEINNNAPKRYADQLIRQLKEIYRKSKCKFDTTEKEESSL